MTKTELKMRILEQKLRKKAEEHRLLNKNANLDDIEAVFATKKAKKRQTSVKTRDFAKFYRHFAENVPLPPSKRAQSRPPVSRDPNEAFAKLRYRKELISDLKRHRED